MLKELVPTLACLNSRRGRSFWILIVCRKRQTQFVTRMKASRIG